LIHSLIDNFMTQPHGRVVEDAQSKMTADLRRAPPLTKQLGDHTTELAVDVDAASVPACPPHGGAAMSIDRAIPAAGDRVAPKLP
jgi:hypothetical protein